MATDMKQGIRSAARMVLGTVALLGTAFLAQGCVVDSAPSCAPGNVQGRWFLSENGQQVQCAPGDEVDLLVDGLAVDPPFQCSAGTGISPPVTGGVNHSVALELYDANSVLLSRTNAMSLFVPCGTVQPTPLVDFSLTP
jgi:hypothetical protein